ncbi:MAG TPA: aminotransferase class I/II-fold pyridoxal phosphate-dependent enzyme, partial [Nocardioides sp.]
MVEVRAERASGPRRPIVDLTDEEARRRLPLKWGVPEGVIPAWVAEMDYAVDPVVLAAVQEMLADGITGYPVGGWDPALAESYVGWSTRHFGWAPEPEAVHPVVDVTAGVRLAIDVFSGPGGVVFPTPGYNAQHGLASVTGRAEHLLEVPTSAQRCEIDLDALDRLFTEGAQTLLLTQPHNPWGRVFTRAELEGIRDVVVRHGARVVSDEIHAPLVLPGAEHVSYLSIEGTHDHAVAVVASSKAFNTAGLKCAQVVTGDDATRDRLLAAPMAR